MFLLLLFPSQHGIWVQGDERCPHGMRGNEHPIPVTLSGRACLCTQASDLIVEVAVSCVLISEHERAIQADRSGGSNQAPHQR